MKRSKGLLIAITTTIILAAAISATAAEFTINGKPATEGQAVKALDKDPTVKVLKITEMTLNVDKMRLKSKSK